MSLSAKVKTAFEILAPVFDVNAAVPSLVVDQNDKHPVCYDPKRKLIFMRSDIQDGLTSEYAVGEEVGHYLHHALNPEAFAYKERLFERRHQGTSVQVELALYDNYIECVGNYAGLVVVGRLFPAEAKQFAENMVRKATKITRNNRMPEYQEITHAMGYLHGALNFIVHGETKLAAIARFTPKEGLLMLQGKLMGQY